MDNIIKLWSDHLLPTAYIQEHNGCLASDQLLIEIQHAFFQTMKSELDKHISGQQEGYQVHVIIGWIQSRLKGERKEVVDLISKALAKHHKKVHHVCFPCIRRTVVAPVSHSCTPR